MELFAGDSDVCERLISLLEYMVLCGVGGLSALPVSLSDERVESALEKGTYYRNMLTSSLLELHGLRAHLQLIESKFSEVREQVNIVNVTISITRSSSEEANDAIAQIWHRVKRLSSRLDICLYVVLQVQQQTQEREREDEEEEEEPVGQGQGQYLVLTCRPAGKCGATAAAAAAGGATAAPSAAIRSTATETQAARNMDIAKAMVDVTSPSAAGE